jgi:hypothetical protein
MATRFFSSSPNACSEFVQKNCNEIMSGIALLFFAAFEIRYTCFGRQLLKFSCFLEFKKLRKRALFGESPGDVGRCFPV